LELFQLSDHLPLAKEVLREVKGTPQANEVLKRLTRRRLVGVADCRVYHRNLQVAAKRNF
jgi:hypothetical protein